MRILVVADDLTGANDTAVQFVNTGAKAITVLHDQAEFSVDGEVVAIITETRGLTGECAYDLITSKLSVKRIHEFDLVYKKIDSVLRGQIGKEIDAIIDAMGFEAALVVPAYPVNERITVGGYHLVNQVPVGDSYVSKDPITPVTKSSIIDILSEQSRYPIGHIYLDAVGEGPIAIRQALEKQCASGCRLISADASTEKHLENLAKALLMTDGVVACGSAGLAQGLAKILPFRRQCYNDDWSKVAERPVVGISGSRSTVSLKQVEKASEIFGLPTIEVRPGKLCLPETSTEEIAQVVNRAVRELKRNQSVLVYVGEYEGNPISKDTLRKCILDSLALIGKEVVSAVDPKCIVLNGGDTAISVCRGLSVSSLEIKKEIQPGIVLALASSGEAPGISVITKSGSFGEVDTIAHLFGLK